jgi:hypothetical protein
VRRRTLLSIVGSGAVVGLAGCAGHSPTPTAAPPASPAPLESYDCPPAAPERTSVVCSHTVDPGEASVYLLPSERTGSERGSLDLTLHNDSTTDLTFNPYSWTVRHERTTGWERLERRSQGDGRLVVGSGETHTWTFESVVDTVDSEATVGPGTYAAEISVPDPTGSDWLDCVALFRLD